MRSTFFTHNREKLRNVCDGAGLIIIAGNEEIQSVNDMAYPFLQDASFLWLTGISKPGWKLVIDGTAQKEWLIAPVQSDVEIIFSGKDDWSDAREKSGIDHVVSGDDGEALMKELQARHTTVTTLGVNPYEEGISFTRNPSAAIHRAWLERYFSDIQDCRPHINKLRAIKSNEEVAALRRAVEITSEAFTKAKRAIVKSKAENDIHAEFDYAFRKQGVVHAYEPIVAAGANAVALHYVANNAPLPKSGLVVIDIGASYRGYAADITRTYAIGQPSEREVAVFTAVQAAQTRIIGCIAPGLKTADYIQKVDRIMKEALQSLGLLDSFDDDVTYRKYFPHAVSHGLGLDVHESLGGFGELMPGMVLTVEPGIYIPEEGIGVRIEDDILVTETGNENLSGSLSTEL